MKRLLYDYCYVTQRKVCYNFGAISPNLSSETPHSASDFLCSVLCTFNAEFFVLFWAIWAKPKEIRTSVQLFTCKHRDSTIGYPYDTRRIPIRYKAKNAQIVLVLYIYNVYIYILTKIT